MSSKWQCEICDLWIPKNFASCLCGGSQTQTKNSSIDLPDVLLFYICKLLFYPEVMRLHRVSFFWNELLTSKMARDWNYFPILTNIEFSHVIYTLQSFNQIQIFDDDTIATSKYEHNAQFSSWNCWNSEGYFKKKITSQISNFSRTFVQDEKNKAVMIFNYLSIPQTMESYSRYFDLENNVYWISLSSPLILSDNYDHYWYSDSQIILFTRGNSVILYTIAGQKIQVISNLSTFYKVVSVQFYDGQIWILYPNILLCYQVNGSASNQYKNFPGLLWSCLTIQANFIILYEKKECCVNIIDRRFPNKIIIYKNKVPYNCKKLHIVNHFVCVQGNDKKSIVLFKLIKKE